MAVIISRQSSYCPNFATAPCRVPHQFRCFTVTAPGPRPGLVQPDQQGTQALWRLEPVARRAIRGWGIVACRGWGVFGHGGTSREGGAPPEPTPERAPAHPYKGDPSADAPLTLRRA